MGKGLDLTRFSIIDIKTYVLSPEDVVFLFCLWTAGGLPLREPCCNCFRGGGLFAFSVIVCHG